MKDPISPKTEQAAQTASDSVSQCLQVAIMSNGRGTSMDQAMYISAVGTSSALHLLAALAGRCSVGNSLDECKHNEDHSPLDHINPTSIMFGAILTAVASSSPLQEDTKGKGFAFEFGPDIILQALELTEKVMGHNPDKFLNKKMVGIVREIEKGATDPLGKFLAQKPSSPSMPN